jgi:hypothetical protein
MANGKGSLMGLGAVVAERWAKKLAAPPRTLAQKLGVGPLAKALVIGMVKDAALRVRLRIDWFRSLTGGSPANSITTDSPGDGAGKVGRTPGSWAEP